MSTPRILPTDEISDYPTVQNQNADDIDDLALSAKVSDVLTNRDRLILLDDFDRPDGAPGSPLVGPDWTGSAQIVDGKLVGDAVLDLGTADYVMRCTFDASEDQRLMFRYVDTTNFLGLTVTSEFRHFNIDRFLNGSPTVIAQTGWPAGVQPEDEKSIELTLRASGRYVHGMLGAGRILNPSAGINHNGENPSHEQFVGATKIGFSSGNPSNPFILHDIAVWSL